MWALEFIIEEIGGFKLITPLDPLPLALGLPSMSDLNQELKLWWRLKKRVLEAAVPRIALGSNEPWNIMSRSNLHKYSLLKPCIIDRHNGHSSSSPESCFNQTSSRKHLPANAVYRPTIL